MDLSVEDLVILNLFSGERETQIQGALDLSNLGKKQRQKISERGVIAPMVSMLNSQDIQVIEAALSALLSLAFGSERNKIRIVKAGALPVLLQLLVLDSETKHDLVELALTFLLVLSSCTKNKLKIASSGAIQLLVNILGSESDYSTCSFSVQAKADAISTLHNLSTHNQIIPLIVSSGALYTLLQLINFSEKSSELTEKASALLEKMVSFSPKSISSIDGGIRVLVETIEEGSNQCKEHAAGTLLSLCKSDRDKYREMILREGGIPGLLQMSVDGTWRAKEMATELLLLLRDCSNHSLRTKKPKHEVIEQIMQKIDQHGEKIPETTIRLVEKMIAKLRT